MARKGDIDSKSVSSRVPMEVFLKLQKQAFDKKQTMSAYLSDILSKDNFGQGVETKIEYMDRVVPKIDYKMLQENKDLKEKVESLMSSIYGLRDVIRDNNKEISELKKKLEIKKP